MQGGLFINLYDQETLKLYLDRGVYAQHVSPEEGEPHPNSAYYSILGDYAATREGYHVFFFRDREIYYGGQVVGSDEYGAFYINGSTQGPVQREIGAPLVWDESVRKRYDNVDKPEVFDGGDDRGKKCQPFLLQFEDNLNMAGRYIISDQLYFRLGEYPYPLPSNSISGMGFCTITPRETELLLDLLKNDPEGEIEPNSDEPVYLNGDPVPYDPDYLTDNPNEAYPEAQLEAAVLGNPNILPNHLQPETDSILTRQVPISPFKPSGIDQADVCYFNSNRIQDGTIPNTIIELKMKKAGKQEALQVRRYLEWLHDRLGNEATNIEVNIYAPGFTRTFDGYIPEALLKYVGKCDFVNR